MKNLVLENKKCNATGVLLKKKRLKVGSEKKEYGELILI